MNEEQLKAHLESKTKEELIDLVTILHTKLNNLDLVELSYFHISTITDLIED